VFVHDGIVYGRWIGGCCCGGIRTMATTGWWLLRGDCCFSGGNMAAATKDIRWYCGDRMVATVVGCWLSVSAMEWWCLLRYDVGGGCYCGELIVVVWWLR